MMWDFAGFRPDTFLEDFCAQYFGRENAKTAARLYRAAGFEVVERRPGRHWGADVVEERYELRLRQESPHSFKD